MTPELKLFIGITFGLFVCLRLLLTLVMYCISMDGKGVDKSLRNTLAYLVGFIIYLTITIFWK